MAVVHKAPRGEPACAAHWALALIEQHPELAGALRPDLELADLRKRLRAALAEGKPGPVLNREELVANALKDAGGEAAVLQRLAQAVSAACKDVLAADAPVAAHPTAPGSPTQETPPSSAPSPSRKASASVSPRKRSALDRHAQNLTAAARAGKLAPTVGRAEEIELCLETLCRVTKRNPALVGPAGVGKTAIVEGLAKRLAEGDAPAMLQGMTIYALQPAMLMAGALTVPDYIERVRDVISEASAPDVILFVDEAHALISHGSGAGQDLVTLLKPALARGDLACIAATTDHEYRAFIEQDTALERRFQPIRVAELSPTDTLKVLEAHAGFIGSKRGVVASQAALRRVVALAAERMPNRQFPDKGVDVLEQAMAHAVATGRKRVGVPDVDAIVQRLTGAPADMQSRLEALGDDLTAHGLMAPDDIQGLQLQLRVATSGLDARPERPNAVILMQAEAARAVAEAVATAMAGSPERIVTYDLGGMTHPADVSRLIGSAPGYVGHGEQLPIHALIQYPWSVVLFQDVDQCHPSVAATVASAIQSGVLTDGSGRAIRLCDSVVILTACRGRDPKDDSAIGLRSGGRRAARVSSAAREVPHDIARLCTQVIERAGPKPADAGAARADADFLDRVAERYALHGIAIEWGDGVAEWLAAAREPGSDGAPDENAMMLRIGEVVLPHEPQSGRVRVRLVVTDGALAAEVHTTGTRTAGRES
jgi:ATP-dependent Clp protease ATP-binding subunit ClpC